MIIDDLGLGILLVIVFIIMFGSCPAEQSAAEVNAINRQTRATKRLCESNYIINGYSHLAKRCFE
jgi:hypothetical protein